MRILQGRDNTVMAMAFAPDGVLLAASGRVGGVHVWDTHSGELLAHFDIPTGYYSEPKLFFTKPHEVCMCAHRMAYLCDPRTLQYERWKDANFCDSEAWHVMHAEEERIERVYQFFAAQLPAWDKSVWRVLHDASDLHYACDEREQWMAARTKRAIYLCDRTQPQTPLREITNPSERDFTMCALHPEGTQLATLAGEKQVRLWDTRTLELQATMAWEVGTLHTVAYAPDGLRAAVGTGSGKVLLWDVE